MARNISHEPCTLVYTLLDSNAISFEDFSLIVRSLHSYMVDSIKPNPEQLNVHVKLNYQASLVNATAKLGDLQQYVGLTKLSSFVQDSELTRLEMLRKQFNICTDAVPEPAPRHRPVQRRPTANRANRAFNPRNVPYARPVPQPIVHAPPQYETEDLYATQQPSDDYTQVIE